MIDGNQLREEFGRYLAEHKATRWGMDAALMHVCKIAYDAGKADGPGAVPREEAIGTADYTDEAERLIEEYGNAEWKVGRMSEHSDDAEEIVARENARAALLAHIQRGAPAPAGVPMPDVFMYGVKEPDGGAWMGEVCVSTLKGDVDELVDELNNDCDDADTRYTTVSLVTTEDAKRYGDAREAAGYARGVADERERCASVAWAHYMDTCRRKGIGPDVLPDWCCAAALREEVK